MSVWQENLNINLGEMRNETSKGYPGKKANTQQPKTDQTSWVHQYSTPNASEKKLTNRFKELFTIRLLSPCNHPSNGLISTLNTVKNNDDDARLQRCNLPLHLCANPFFVFCSFKLPFILSLSLISSISCLCPLLPTSYQTVPGWEASKEWRGGEEERREK